MKERYDYYQKYVLPLQRKLQNLNTESQGLHEQISNAQDAREVQIQKLS